MTGECFKSHYTDRLLPEASNISVVYVPFYPARTSSLLPLTPPTAVISQLISPLMYTCYLLPQSQVCSHHLSHYCEMKLTLTSTFFQLAEKVML